MGDDSLKLREDGYIRMNFPVTSLTYHSNLNIILVKTDNGDVHVLDVNSGVILQSSCLLADDGGTCGVEYASGADRVFVWDSSGVGARTDYNGVLLLHTALQRPLPSSQPERNIRIELVLSEAILLYQCLQSLDAHSIEGLPDVINELKTAIDAEPVRKGVKAQKWSTVTISLPQTTLRLVTTGVVQELKGQNRRVPALAIASAVGQRANELVPCSRDEETRPLMYSEAERKETFKRWPHMDYKWALPARMAQAGFYHQPSPSGDDRAMCFTCLVCLVCWEKSDEPWVEHERHSPNCPFVRGEYTHNVPISVTNATACAVPCPNVTVVSKGNMGDLIATGTVEGKVNVWKFDCGLKLVKFIHLSPYDSIFSGILSSDQNKVWSSTLEKDSSTYGIELTAMAFVGMTSRPEAHPQTQTTESADKETNANKAKPSLICAVIVTQTCLPQTDVPVTEDSSKALFDAGDEKPPENIEAMNSQNDAKSLSAPTVKMLFLLTYDIHSSLAGSITTVAQTSNSGGNSKPGGSKKVCAVPRTDDACIYDEVYFQYSDEDTELPQCPNNLIDEQISNVINLNASSSKEDCKIWDHKQIILTKHFKMLPAPIGLLPELHEMEQSNMLDFVGKISQLKSWKNSVVAKLKDQTDSVIQQADPLSHYLNVNGPLEISDLKFYEGGGEGTEKVKVTTFGGSKVGSQTQAVNNTNNDGFESDPPQEEAVSQGVAVQCLNLPQFLNLKETAKVTHLLPTEDKEHLILVISSIDPEKAKVYEEVDNDGDTIMEFDDFAEQSEKHSDLKAHFILYKINNKSSICTIEDNPVTVKELPYNESPVDLCLLPSDKHEQYSFAAVGVDGALRLYSIPDFKNLSEKRVSKGHFASVAYCVSVERLSVSTKRGMIYFYALNNGEKDSVRDVDEDEFANIDFDMLQRVPRDEVCGPSTTAPVIIANKTELDMGDLQTLISLTGCYGTNTTVPYSAVVPGFWCELSPAQRPRSDHQNNRTWRLQNTSSTWDEHVLEITLPYSVSLAHIEFSFTLHVANSTNLPVILVTLLKQNLHGIGYKKDAVFGHSESPLFPEIDADLSNLDNPINCDEYLQAHNAEILAGPLLLSTGLDLSQQTGTLTLTSPLLYRARGRTFLIHIKTLFDPAKDMTKVSNKSSEGNSKKSGFIGCDWLHQISLTVRSTPHTDVPMERQQRITMLESDSFLNTLCELAVSKDDCEKRKLALDIIIWIMFVRLQRMRLVSAEKEKDDSVETQQLECIRIIEKHIDAMIKNCILCGNRSLAKKCMKIILITSEGEKQLPKPWKSTFETSVSKSVCACLPYLGACESAGALRWIAALGQHVAQHASQQSAQHTADQQDVSTKQKSTITELVSACLALLQRTARNLRDRSIPYHDLLRARFGLYGLPLERTIFATEIPDLGRNNSSSSNYSNVLTGDSSGINKQECQLKDLLNLPVDADPQNLAASTAWWNQSNGVGVFAAGLSEAMPLHVTCHMASDGTKLESSGSRHHPAVVSSLPSAGPTDANQLWNVVKDGQMKQSSQDPDSLEDAESSLMECDPQEKSEFTEDKLFKEDELCNIPWGMLVSRPPQHTLVVERMHSGARRYIVLDFGHTVRLTDLIIPSCSDLVTLCIDIWVTSEETDCVKLAFAVDISTKHLVLTDIQPPPLCRFMKITTIGRYGMSATKCKIPLGWFYGEVADISNVQASVNALNALHQDLTCKFRLATGKLIDKLNPYLEMYNGNASHMMAYLGTVSERDMRVNDAYQDCLELQQQLHTCTSILNKLQNKADNNRHIPDLIDKGTISSESLLQSASTDKLRIISENVVDMLLYFYTQIPDIQYGEVQEDWCRQVSPLVWDWGGRSAGALATLLARACGDRPWWGAHLADTLTQAFAAYDAPPTPLDRCLVVVMYMCRMSLFAQADCSRGVTYAFASRTLQLLQSPRATPSPSSTHPAHPALTAALITTLSFILDVLALPYTKHSRWDWVTGGRLSNTSNIENNVSTTPRGSDGKLYRRKLHKKLLHQMQEIDKTRRGVHFTLEDQQRARLMLKARMAMLGKRSGNKPESTSGSETPPPPRALPPQLAAQLAQAVVAYMLAADTNATHDVLLLSAKVVGRLCALSSGYSQLDPQSILGVARLAVTLPPWPRHALTTLLQDLVEYEGDDSPTSPNEDWGGPAGMGGASTASGAGGSRVTLDASGKCQHGFAKPPRKTKGPTVADILADSFSINKTIKIPISGGIMSTMSMKDLDSEEQLTQVAESDDSESSEEKLEHSSFLDGTKKETKTKIVVDNNTSNISMCSDCRLESAGGGAGGPGESAVRRALLATGNVFAVAVRTPPVVPRPAAAVIAEGVQPGGSASSAEGGPSSAPVSVREEVVPPHRLQPPLTHTLYDVFRHLALEFDNQMECTFMENVVSLWLTLNGSSWGSGGSWALGTLPADTPRVRLAADTVTALLRSLCTLEHVTLRCWVLSMQAVAWVASLPLLTEGSSQTMGRVILDCEHFVPAIVKFVTINVNSDGAVYTSEPYLGGALVGGGGCAAAALHAVVTRVICARGAGGALAALRCVCGAWVRAAQPYAVATTAYDLHATLLRLAQPMLQLLAPHHDNYVTQALQLFEAVGQLSASWVREQAGSRSDSSGSSSGGGGSSGSGGSTGGAESRLSGLLADVMAGSGPAARRLPLRRAVLLQLLYYCRVLLAVPLPAHLHASSPSRTANSSGAPEQCQTDESKAQHSARDTINVEDERKQQAARTPCLADSVLQQHTTMHYFYKTLSMSDGTNMSHKYLEKNLSNLSTDSSTFMEELYCLVAHIINIASNPALMVQSLMGFLRREDVVQLSQGMQHLIIRLLDNPEALNAFIDAGGLELAVEKLVAFHQLGPSNGQGLVASLMNYLKLPPHLINLSTSANSNSNKKNQAPVVDPDNGLINIAPLCSVTCGNPTAQPADVLLEGGAAVSVRTACAARRVRAAAWSYHFFSVDDASLALTVTLPYAALLHELHLQPHLASLATCPGAVGVEAGCGGTLSPLGPPQSTAGMTFIRLVVSRPVLATTVQVRLYKPRDSANMGLLQLRLLVAPAFNPATPPSDSFSGNNWSSVVFASTRGGSQWAGTISTAALSALCACACLPISVLSARHAHRSVLALARNFPHLRASILGALLAMDTQAHAYGAPGANTENMNSVCSLVRQVCVQSPAHSLGAYLQWASAAAETWLRTRTPPPAALLHTLASVLWALKEKDLLDNAHKLITDDVFELLYTWINDVPETSMMKKALDSILCSVCYIQSDLFKTFLEHMDILIDEDDSMEGMTDDTKVQGSPVRTAPPTTSTSAPGLGSVAWRMRACQLRSIAIASMSSDAAHMLLRSRLPADLVQAIAEFSDAKLAAIIKHSGSQEDINVSNAEKMSACPNTGVASMKRVCQLVEWMRLVSGDRRFKDWLGRDGAAFWAPLLRLLCHPRNKESTWQESAQYAQLEEETIRLFYELTVCHIPNQKLFAATLYNILESQQCTGAEGISGFTRALIVRLVLSPERVRVSMRWLARSSSAHDVLDKSAGGGAGGFGSVRVAGAGAVTWPGGVAAHPSLQHHMLMNVPLDMTLSDLVGAGHGNNPSASEDSKSGPSGGSGTAPVLRSASDPAIPAVTETWELSLAAGSASKDKRVKDVKNTNLKNHNLKKRQFKIDDISFLTHGDATVPGRREGSNSETGGSGGEAGIRVRVAGLVGWVPATTTLAQLAAAVPQAYGPHVALTMHVNDGEAAVGPTWEGLPSGSDAEGSSNAAGKNGGLVREFGTCGGLALVASRLPRPRAAPPDPPAPAPPHDLDWVKLDDPYEEVLDLGGGAMLGGGGSSSTSSEEPGCGGVPAHALLALGLLLKLPGYADALLDEGARAVHLLRLLLGVTHDEDGRNIQVCGTSSDQCGKSAGAGGGSAGTRWSLGTLPFVIVSRLLEREGCEGRSSPEGRELRRALLSLGAVRLVLACLAVFTHHRPTSAENSHGSNGSTGKIEEKNQLYWAKGTGFGTGSTQQSWNVEQALMRQKTEEEHVTVLLQVLASYMNPGEKWPPEGQETNEETDDNITEENGENCADLAPEFIDLIANSSLVPAICSYLRNDSVLDMSRHIPLYVCVLRCARGVYGVRCERLRAALRPLPRLLAQMSRTTNSYATKLKMSKKNIFGKMTYSQRFNSSNNTELSEEDEGLATLIADIQATSALICRGLNSDDENGRGGSSGDLALSTLPTASREVRYIDLMRTMQFDTYEMITECAESGCGFRFTVPYHFEGTVRSAGERAHPARMKRLAQEAATLATSLPLSYSSSVFVRYDSVRLDVMKVLITGPSDTPYANGCFILDVYFPAEYPAVPMLINLETTGRHSVRFNPNLYNDGKVCLSVLNTWHGRPEEKWNAHTSSFLQVLVSIQSLILVPEPYFNEPGYERSRGTRVGNSASLEYNSNIYQACVRWAMLDHLRNPEPCFKEVIQTHFWIKRNEIMQTVANWITELEGQSGDERTQTSIRLNLIALKRHYVKLQEELAKLPVPPGLEELDEPFQLPAAPTAAPPPSSDDMYQDFEKIVSEVLD